MLKVAVIFALSVIIPLCSSGYNDTCVDRPFCGGPCSCENIRLKCPTKCRVCSSMQMTSEEEIEIDDRKPKYKCENGWSKISGNQFTERGAMKSMTGRIDFGSATRKTMYIYGRNYDALAYIYFESKEKPHDVLFYMELDFPFRQIILSRRTGGKWNNYAVFPIVLRCPETEAETHLFWMIELEFVEDSEQQFIHIVDGINGKTICRFYPENRVKKGDRYYFTQTGYNVFGVTWSSGDSKTFESGLPTDSAIQLIGKILGDEVEITLSKKNGDHSADILFTRNEEDDTEVEVTISGITTIGKCESCPYAELNDDSLTVITIRRKEEGLEVWNKGALYVTVNDPNMKDDDIEKVQVIRGFQTYGISVLDCETSRTK